jgi:GT2 family glycosyltransferase
LTELTKHIYHIPKILYHWRSIPESTASGVTAKEYTNSAGFRAVNDAIQRRKIDGWVETDSEIANLYRVHYQPTANPLISIIIPTRNMGGILEKCISSIFTKTNYIHFEVIIVDNGSNEQETFDVFNKWLKQEPKRFFVERMDIPFNYSKLNNQAVEVARGDLILLLNNDVEVISPDWLGEMAGQAIRPEIGAVGACLLYPDNTIQHAGIILGIGGIAGHSHKYYAEDHPGYFSRLKIIVNYSAVTAACLMVRRELYLKVGGLSTELSVAFNDVDFCLKLRSEGYYNIWLPQVRLYHHESKSRGQEDTPEKLLRFNKEIEYMNKRWIKMLKNDPFYNINLTAKHEDFSLASHESL